MKRTYLILPLIGALLVACSDDDNSPSTKKASTTDSPYVTTVKNVYVDGAQTITLDSVLRNRALCSSTHWQTKSDEFDRNIVEYQCHIGGLNEYYTNLRENYIHDKEKQYADMIAYSQESLAEAKEYEAAAIAEKQANIAEMEALLELFKRGEGVEKFTHYEYSITKKRIPIFKALTETVKAVRANPTAENVYELLNSEAFREATHANDYTLRNFYYSNDVSVFSVQYGYRLRDSNYDASNYNRYLNGVIEDLPQFEQNLANALNDLIQTEKSLREQLIAYGIEELESEIKNVSAELQKYAHVDSERIEKQIEMYQNHSNAVAQNAAERYPIYERMTESIQWVVNEYGEVFFLQGSIIANDQGTPVKRLQYNDKSYIPYIFNHRNNRDIEGYLNQYSGFIFSSLIYEEAQRQGLF